MKNLWKLILNVLHKHYRAPLVRATMLANGSWRLTYRCSDCGYERHETVPDMVTHLARQLGIREEDL